MLVGQHLGPFAIEKELGAGAMGAVYLGRYVKTGARVAIKIMNPGTANSQATAKMVAVIYQKAPYAIFSLRSGANVTKPEQLENLEIASGAGSFTQKVIEAFMKSKGLKL